MNFRDIKGIENVKRALEIAATGNHSILIVGPANSGKSMCAAALSEIIEGLKVYDEVHSMPTVRISALCKALEKRGDKMILVLSRPCLCGNYRSDVKCVCRAKQIERVRAKLTAISDKIEMVVFSHWPHYQRMFEKNIEPSEAIKQRIIAARAVATPTWHYNAIDLLKESMKEGNWSPFHINASQRIAETIAKLDNGNANVLPIHVAEAVQYAYHRRLRAE